MEDEIRRLIDKCEQSINDYTQNNSPIEQTDKEQYRLEGYNAALIRFISELKEIFRKVEPDLKEKLSYTE